MTAPSGRPSARVVLVNWRNAPLTIRAAESIRPQLRDGDRLVVVDNASGDGSSDELRAAGLDVVESPVNGGFGPGANLGARGLDEDVLVLLNNDAVAEPGFLDALLAPWDEPGTARLGGVTALMLLAGRWEEVPAGAEAPSDLIGLDGAHWRRVPDGAEEADRGEVLVNSTGNVLDASGNGYDRDWLAPAEGLSAPRAVFGVCGGACAIARQAWEELGGFREDLFMYYEDTDLSWRLHEAGWQVEYAAGAVVRHEHAASSDAASPMFVRVNARNRLLVAAEHSPAPVVVRAAARTAARALRSGLRGPAAEGSLEGIAGLPAALRRRRQRARA